MIFYKVLKEQIKSLFVYLGIYILCILIYLPFDNYFNKFDLNQRFGKEFSFLAILSTLTFSIVYIFLVKKIILTNLKFSKLDLKFILFSFLSPILITNIISLFELSIIKYNYFDINIIYLFIYFLIFALVEEVIFRSVLLFSDIQNSSLKFRVVTSSLLFSLAHIGNSSYNITSFIILFLSGIILSYIYLKTNLITVTISHALWNSASSIIIGGYVSGFKVKYSLFTYEHVEDNMVNGGKFGIEGSIFTLIFLLIITLFILFKKYFLSKNKATDNDQSFTF
jgi:hypothetical protein